MRIVVGVIVLLSAMSSQIAVAEPLKRARRDRSAIVSVLHKALMPGNISAEIAAPLAARYPLLFAKLSPRDAITQLNHAQANV